MSGDTEGPEQLIARLNAGDSEAVTTLFEAYGPYLCMVVRRRLGPKLRTRVDSSDIVQSVFADVVTGLRQGNWHFNSPAELRAFLRRIAWRRLADRFEKHRKSLEHEQRLETIPPGAAPASSMPRASEVARGNELWDEMLRQCPDSHHEVVRLRLHGLKMSEIAERTGLHPGSVRRILYELARRLSLSAPHATPPVATDSV